MKFRKLRIAWSVAWGVLGVLLCVLWVRSYSKVTFISRIDEPELLTGIESEAGTLSISRIDLRRFPKRRDTQPHGWEVTEDDVILENNDDLLLENPSSFAWEWNETTHELRLPYWLFVISSAGLATLPWLPLKHFSLRTLLIATTLIAVVLGMVVWGSRAG